jgi:hypothetical protein
MLRNRTLKRRHVHNIEKMEVNEMRENPMKYPGNHPEDYEKLTPSDKATVSLWIQQHISTRKAENYRHTSYGLKHLMANQNGLYTTNGQFKGAMLAAGFEPVRPHTLNWTFRINYVALRVIEPAEVAKLIREYMNRISEKVTGELSPLDYLTINWTHWCQVHFRKPTDRKHFVAALKTCGYDRRDPSKTFNEEIIIPNIDDQSNTTLANRLSKRYNHHGYELTRIRPANLEHRAINLDLSKLYEGAK